MPVWHGSIAIQEKHQRNGLWSVTIGSHQTSYDGACRAICTLVQEEEVTPSMTCVAHTNGVSSWRADFSGTHRPTSLNNPCQWLLPANFPPRKHWYRPHFEVLTYFGVWCTGDHSTVFNVDNSATSRASVAQLVRARDCQSLGRRFDSIKNPITQIPMNLNFIDPQTRVLNYF